MILMPIKKTVLLAAGVKGVKQEIENETDK
jgi:hypothetical protein